MQHKTSHRRWSGTGDCPWCACGPENLISIFLNNVIIVTLFLLLNTVIAVSARDSQPRGNESLKSLVDRHPWGDKNRDTGQSWS